MDDIVFRSMRTAPKDGRLILVDRMPESKTPATCYWSGKWWMGPEGGWENHATGWTDFPPPHTDKPQERRPDTNQAD